MTTTAHEAFSGTRLVCRPEGDDFLIYVPQRGVYLYATASGRDLLTVLTEASVEADSAALLVGMRGLSSAVAEAWAQCIGDLLGGVRPAATDDSARRDEIGIWLIEEVMGDKGQRCETFGMPF